MTNSDRQKYVQNCSMYRIKDVLMARRNLISVNEHWLANTTGQYAQSLFLTSPIHSVTSLSVHQALKKCPSALWHHIILWMGTLLGQHTTLTVLLFWSLTMEFWGCIPHHQGIEFPRNMQRSLIQQYHLAELCTTILNTHLQARTDIQGCFFTGCTYNVPPTHSSLLF